MVSFALGMKLRFNEAEASLPRNTAGAVADQMGEVLALQ